MNEDAELQEIEQRHGLPDSGVLVWLSKCDQCGQLHKLKIGMIAPDLQDTPGGALVHYHELSRTEALVLAEGLIHGIRCAERNGEIREERG